MGTLTPAYGRDYRSKAMLEKDWRDGKDFVLNSPFGQTYCNIDSFDKGTKLQARYSKLQKVCMVTV